MSTKKSKPSPGPETWSVGPYHLSLELGSGGMGTVYLGHSQLGRGGQVAAVKILHPHIATDATFMDMFLDEGEIASRIRHPNVCEVYQVEAHEKVAYIAMEYLSGETLRRVANQVRRAGVDPRVAAVRMAAALADACEGLHAAHELTDDRGEPLGVVHRDVTPTNLFLTLDGVAKVLDFGVVAATGKRHRTKTGILKGKLAYMAPEMLEGAPPQRTADVWSMGVVAWELMTGKRLFHGKSDIETLRAVQRGDIRPPSEVTPGVPPAMDAVVLRALRRNPDERQPTARALGRALTEAAIQQELITTADLAEWMKELFPGARQRTEQALTLGAQLAAHHEATTHHLKLEELMPTMVAPSSSRPPASTPPPQSSAPPPHSSAPPPRAPGDDTPSTLVPSSGGSTPSHAHSWQRSLLAGAVGAGLAFAATLTVEALTRGDAPAPLPELPSAAAPASDERPAVSQSRARVTNGGQLEVESDDYVLSVVQSSADELLLRIESRREVPTTAEPQLEHPEGLETPEELESNASGHREPDQNTATRQASAGSVSSLPLRR